MMSLATIGALLAFQTYDEPLRTLPPRKGLRPGTASGDPQIPF